MGLSYHYTFAASETYSASELELFLRNVEAEAQTLGFNPTAVLNTPFRTREERVLARRLTTGLHLESLELEGISLLDESQVWSHDPKTGSCRIIPTHGVFLILTNELGIESLFGFLKFPNELFDLTGRPIVKAPLRNSWWFRDFINSPDKRYRYVVEEFAKAGFLQHELDEFNRQ